MSSYYLLGYYSTNAALDGKFRKITVKLKNPRLAAQAGAPGRLLCRQSLGQVERAG